MAVLRKAYLRMLLARLLTKSYAEPTTRNAFLVNLEIIWCLTLIVTALSLVPSLEI